jgi:hypothetical protein
MFFLQYKNVVSIELVIVNRWGDVMFDGTWYDLTLAQPIWDGKFNSKEANEGVYTYTYSAVGVSGAEISGHGFFHLIRK